MGKKNKLIFLSLLMMFILIGDVLAITGSIGNARMVLRAKTGEEIEKYILVKNVNDVALDIELFASGDLESYVDIKDKEFRLEPGEEKKAYFTIKVAKEGTTETKINVKFTPEEGNGVGLSSSVIVIAEKGDSWFDWGSEEDESDEEDSGNSVTNSITGKVIGVSNKKIIVVALSSMTLIILCLFIFLLFLKNKRARVSENLLEKTKPKKNVKKRD